MLYCAGYDVSDLALGTITLATAGQSDVVVTLNAVTGTDQNSASTSLFFSIFTGGGSVVSEGPDAGTKLATYANTGYFTALQDALQAEATTQSWPSPSNVSVSVSTTTGLVTIAYSASISITWSAATGRNFCGFYQNVSGATSHAGDVTPLYLINPTLPETSLSTPNYEPAGVGNHITADDGTGYGLSRTVSPLWRDWTQEYETKAKTIRLAADDGDASGDHPWSFQDLFEHCRGEFPFIVMDGFGEAYDEAFSFRTDGIPWNPQRATPGNDNQFHIPFRAVVEGQVVSGS